MNKEGLKAEAADLENSILNITDDIEKETDEGKIEKWKELKWRLEMRLEQVKENLRWL